MQLTRRNFIKLGIALGSATLLPAENVFATTLSTLPAIITMPGTYVLDGNKSVSIIDGAVIDVRADNVTIDLNGKTITNTAAFDGTRAVGVYTSKKKRLAVKNGILRGFHTAVYIHRGDALTGGHLLSDVQADACYAAGFLMQGDGCAIKRCLVTNQQRTGVFDMGGCTASFGIGVRNAIAPLLIDNTIDMTDVGSGDSSIGILLGGGVNDAVVINNQISNADIGILSNGSNRSECRDNECTAVEMPLYGTYINLGNNN